MSNKLPKKPNELPTKLIIKSKGMPFKDNSNWKLQGAPPRRQQMKCQSVPPVIETQESTGTTGTTIKYHISKCLSYMAGIISRQPSPPAPPLAPKNSDTTKDISSVATTRIISEAVYDKSVKTEDLPSDLLTDNVENVGKTAELSEFTLGELADLGEATRGTLSDPVLLSSDNTDNTAHSSASLGQSYGSTQFERGNGYHQLRFLRNKNYDENAYGKKVDERIDENADYINKS